MKALLQPVPPDAASVLFVLPATSAVSDCSTRSSKSFSDTSSSSASLSLSVAESLLWTKNILKIWFFTLKPYPKTLNREFNEDDICAAPSVFVKIVLPSQCVVEIVLPSQCDSVVCEGLSTEMVRHIIW